MNRFAWHNDLSGDGQTDDAPIFQAAINARDEQRTGQHPTPEERAAKLREGWNDDGRFDVQGMMEDLLERWIALEIRTAIYADRLEQGYPVMDLDHTAEGT